MKNNFFKVNSVCRFIFSGKQFFTLLAIAGFFVFGGFFGALDVIAADIVSNQTWTKSQSPVIISEYTRVRPGAKLTIEPGVIIKFAIADDYDDDYYIVSSGVIEALGTESEPIIFTSLRDDERGGDSNNDGDASSSAPGDWMPLYLSSGSTTTLDHAVFNYGGALGQGAINMYRAKLTVSNSIISLNQGGIKNDRGIIEIRDSVIYNNYLEIMPGQSVDPGIENNGGDIIVKAENNWWGSPEGPCPYRQYISPETPPWLIDWSQICPNRVWVDDGVDYDPWLARSPEEKKPDPVILVPGIMGSYQNLNNWVIDPILHTYDNLIEAMIQSGYELNKDLFLFPYNWRQDNVITAGELKNKIAVVKEITGSNKVDLVAHSMGGLVARSYIQGSDYQNDVDQLIFLGTPHLGAPKDYLVYEGAYMPGLVDSILKLLFQLEAAESGYLSLLKYVREQVMSTEQLLPVYNYLQNNSGGEWIDRIYPVQYPRNSFLENLNVPSAVDLLKTRTEITNIFSHKLSAVDNLTLNKIKVVNDPNIYDDKWMDGYPINLEEGSRESYILGGGDGTVPVESLKAISGVDKIEIVNADHRAIVTKAQKEVIQLLTGKNPEQYVEGNFSAIKRILLYRIYSPADFVIIAPDGRRLGKNFNTNLILSEIDGGFYSGFNTDTEFATILNPIDGEYKIELQGTGEGGEYKLSASVISDEEEIDKEFTGTISASQIQEFRLDYTEESEELIGELEPEDNVLPIITINTPTENAEYLHSEKMNIEFTATDDFSGIATTTITLDGVEIATTTIDLFYSKTGEHTLEIMAEDRAGNIGSSTVKFKIIADPDSVISDIKRLYEMRWITDRTTSKIIIREIEDIKWYLKRLDEAKGHILKSIERIEVSKQPEKLKVKLIQRYNEEIARLEKENSKKLNMVFDRIERSLQKYLKRNLINQEAYDIIKDDVNYLRGNL